MAEDPGARADTRRVLHAGMPGTPAGGRHGRDTRRCDRRGVRKRAGCRARGQRGGVLAAVAGEETGAAGVPACHCARGRGGGKGGGLAARGGGGFLVPRGGGGWGGWGACQRRGG